MVHAIGTLCSYAFLSRRGESAVYDISHHDLARAYLADGRVKAAVKLLEHVVAVEEGTFPEEHPERLVSQHGLTRAYEADGQVKKVVKLLEHVVAVRERTLTGEHPERLASQQGLARVYKANRLI